MFVVVDKTFISFTCAEVLRDDTKYDKVVLGVHSYRQEIGFQGDEEISGTLPSTLSEYGEVYVQTANEQGSLCYDRLKKQGSFIFYQHHSQRFNI